MVPGAKRAMVHRMGGAVRREEGRSVEVADENAVGGARRVGGEGGEKANVEITAFEARRALSNGFAIVFYKVHGVGWWRRPEAMCCHPNRALPLDPGRHGRKWPHFTSGETRPSCGIVPLRTP